MVQNPANLCVLRKIWAHGIIKLVFSVDGEADRAPFTGQ